MALSSGTKLGPYEIVAPLGAGGMGEVYRARDTRLGRDVAVKVLPEHLSAEPEVRARFEREARAVSSLNHPHICTLHDVGREGATDFLVMELVEGETLAARLERGALATSEVLRVGGQIADALDRAHRAGIVHRDLKPANVMLTKSGAKLMDFGLARAAGAAGAGSGTSVTLAALSQSPTMSRPLTVEGTIVGTFQYMSPEQLEGREADARSDLWALGCVLYEMATGKRAFEGKSQASLIGAIMHAAPAPLAIVAPMSPPALERLVTACLAKDPADRVQNAHDVKLQLAWMSEGATSASAAAAPAIPATRRRAPWVAPALAALAAAAATALAFTLARSPRERAAAPAPAQRFVLGAADLQPNSAPMISPDGRSVVFSVRDGGSSHIRRRDLASFDVTPIEGTAEGAAPFFSPDGAWLGFITPTAIKKVPVAGGVAQTIVNEPRVDAADWGVDDTIYFAPRAGGSGAVALQRVSAMGGRPEVIASLDTTAHDAEAWLPEILPDGKTVLFSIRGSNSWRIVAIRADGSGHTVVENAFLGRYVRTGYLVFVDAESEAVLAAPFDVASAKVTGAAIPLTERVDTQNGFDASDDGALVYVPLPGSDEGAEVVWIDRKGVAAPLVDVRGEWTQPRVSPDGRRVMIRKIATQCEIWLYDIDRATLGRVAMGFDNHDPVWAPDGRRIAIARADARGEMFAVSVEGARDVAPVPQDGGPATPRSWSAGTNRLAYTINGRGTRSDIWTKSMDGSSPPEPFLATGFDETDPALSPDGRWLAYASNEAGATEVFVRAFPDAGTAWQVSTTGGVTPVWSRDGRELFFASGTKMMAVSIEAGSTLRVGVPFVLFDGAFSTSRGRDFDVAPDGRFVAVRHARGESGSRELRILFGWEQAMTRPARAAH